MLDPEGSRRSQEPHVVLVPKDEWDRMRLRCGDEVVGQLQFRIRELERQLEAARNALIDGADT